MQHFTFYAVLRRRKSAFSYAHMGTLCCAFLIISAIPLCLFSPKGHRYPCGRNDRKRLPGGRSVFSDQIADDRSRAKIEIIAHPFFDFGFRNLCCFRKCLLKRIPVSLRLSLCDLDFTHLSARPPRRYFSPRISLHKRQERSTL